VRPLGGRRNRRIRRRRVPAVLVPVLVLVAAVVVAGTIGLVKLVADDDSGPVPAQAGPWPRWGLTHTQVSADAGDPAATEAAEQLLGEQRLLQNQHIMGWGAGNPEPSPGAYDFSDLDRRMEIIERTGGVPVITLCCAPDWMKGGRPGQTDWSQIERAPLPEHYQDFADLAAEIAARYPEVRHFVVWNELKGFYDDEADRWDYEGYTRMYNLVYEAVKAVNPDNRVGGPYPSMSSEPPGWDGSPSEVAGPWGVVDQRSLDVVDHWLEHKVGADFVVVDGATTVRDGQLTTDPFAATEKLEAVSSWVRERTDLPLWWAEWYVEPPGTRWPEPYRVAVQASAMMALVESDVATALYWNPQEMRQTCPGCLWTSTSSPGGGRATEMADVLAGFARYFPSGTRLVDLPAPSAEVQVLAQPEHAVVVNTADRPLRVTIGDEVLSLDPYEVRFVSHGDS
jgi:Glycosyl hydrolases family 39